LLITISMSEVHTYKDSIVPPRLFKTRHVLSSHLILTKESTLHLVEVYRKSRKGWLRWFYGASRWLYARACVVEGEGLWDFDGLYERFLETRLGALSSKWQWRDEGL
jgi:hypothetical protein